ncbi:MAG: cryptochrome/photolyase family protein [Bacteroidetes bacterium]|nr:cryptochrome/photolyase family protein [Bacteroidota bacterium]
MSAVTLIYPHQLYAANPALQQGRPVWMVEDVLFFRQYSFHKKKIAFHKASMDAMAMQLGQRGFKVQRITHAEESAETGVLMRHMQQQGFSEVHVCEPDDYLLKRRLNREAARRDLRLVWYENPGFLINRAQGSDWLGSNKVHQTSWYIHFRKSLGIMLDAHGKPLGGAWTFDTENRQKTPPGIVIPRLPEIPADTLIQKAIQDTEKQFPANPGSLDTWEYPVTHQAAEAWLEVFLEQRFNRFGIYQDAMVPGESFMFHSVLSPMLNVGLLTPDLVLERALEAAAQFDVPIASLEGFVRQVLGWREFVRAVYHHKGTSMRTTNALNLEAAVPEALYSGNTGIFPFDESVKRLLKTGYSHHIERLMIHGNLMLLLGINPDAVYRWFMELFIDAYDWVMVPNVYGMSQYADFGGMVTKPYVSGSAYLRKMGHFTKAAWCEEWDALYWMFIRQHAEAFRKNPRMAIPVASLGRFTDDKISGMNNTVERLKKRLGLY